MASKCVHTSELVSCESWSSVRSAFTKVHSLFVAPATNEERHMAAHIESKCSFDNCTHNKMLGVRVCLHCIHLGCPDHAVLHAREKRHLLSMELGYGQVYCVECSDFVYHPELDAVADQSWARAQDVTGLGQRFVRWRPGVDTSQLLRRHKLRRGFTTTPSPSRSLSSSATFGLRGLVNLGNTCFMSVILQSLVHTPLLRDYFLSDRHRCNPEEEEKCIVCEMSRIFQEFYSGAKTPLVPHVLLHMTWTFAHHLAGYEQQDAHEFFIAILDLLHRHLNGRSESHHNGNCDCIVDTIFTGKLQSDVVCQSCLNVSTTIDPFWDISLDLPTVVPSNTSGPISLKHCLERFTKPEHLGSAAKIKCSICKSYQESTKQLTMKKLPLVACFHLKRFEHSSRFHKKITTRIAFPESLDLSPFVSHQRTHKRMRTSSPNVTNMNNVYTLFAVVNHVGNIEAGHYTCFIRQHRSRWFRCNDHLISPADLEHVLDSEGYLLFYHKQRLQYK